MARPVQALLAPDKFKGSLTAPEICAIVAPVLESMGWKVDSCPISDGGDGFTETLRAAMGGSFRSLEVRDAIGRNRFANYARCGSVAVMEMAAASGIAALQPHERAPWEASTFGTGQMMRAAMDEGAKEILIGIGGSATNDGGVGMALALGFHFLDAAGNEINDLPARLLDVRSIQPPPPMGVRIRAACDVENPLLGPSGATRVYGPQKGISPTEFERHEARLAHLVSLLDAADAASQAGSGAAGGLGFGLRAFLGATLEPGFAIVSETLGLEARIRAADIVITGEGRLDTSSLQGKAPAALAQLAKSHARRVVALCGAVDTAASDELSILFDQILPITPAEMPLEVATTKEMAATLLRVAAMQIVCD